MRSLVCSAPLRSPPSLSAQKAETVVPKGFANFEGANSITYPLSYQQCRWQMLIDGSQLCNTSAVAALFRLPRGRHRRRPRTTPPRR